MKNQNRNDMIQLFVIAGDFLLLNGILLMFIIFFPSIIPPVLDVKTRVFTLICNVAMMVAQYFFAPVIHRRYVNAGEVIFRVLQLVVIQTLVAFILIRSIYNNGGMFRFMLYYTPTIFIGILLLRLMERIVLNWYRQRGGNTRYVILVGSDPANMNVYNELIEDASTGYKILGYYSDHEIAGAPATLKKLGDIKALNEIIDATENESEDNAESVYHHPDELFCSLSHDNSDEIIKIMRYCDHHVIRFYYVPRMLGNYSLSLKAEQFGSLYLFTNHKEPLIQQGNRFIKRLFDIVVSLCVCLAMLPFIPIIALIIKLQSRGPIFFAQNRTGLNGKTFRCYKFRSMHVNEGADMQQATLDDPRKFSFGNFMRKCNIDEFPQFFNVLKGDMSIVGPRPHMLHHTDVYSELIDKYMVRHFSKPGITGWAQVTGYRGETKELWQMEERVRRDIWYIENWSFWLDIRIIIMTAVSLFKPDKKAY